MSLLRLSAPLVAVGLLVSFFGSATKSEDVKPAAESPAVDGPLAPAAALDTFRLEPGLRIELVAAEPQVVSPCAVTFDERGRMFVAENPGYPTGPKEGEPPVGRIALLEDVDGDGRFEKRTVFADGLTFPNGVMPWDGGLIVTCAPEILYYKDTDGDGRADVRDVWFTGFSTKGSTQLRVSHPTLNIDGWIYVTSGLTGGEIRCPKHPEREPVVIGRTDFRFRPDLSEYEACDGGAQFGLSFDDAGRRFICYNRVQVQHVVLSSQHLKRNPNLPFSETVQNCPADLESEPLRGHGAAAKLFPLSRNITTADSHAGTFTAACAVTVWRGDALPLDYQSGAFSCDPTGNLVHFDRLENNGATFAARRVRDKVEFLATPDSWFRPVFLSHGPDGALYVVDMYRKTIEHPDYLPVEIRKHTDFESGKTMGRIWRVVGTKFDKEELAARRGKRFDAASPESLAQALDSPSGWRRSTAFRLFLERRDPAAVPAITALTAANNSSTTRIAALRLLDAFGVLDDKRLADIIGNVGPANWIETAIRIAETRQPLAQEIGWALCRQGEAQSPRVRFHAALALGGVEGAQAVETLGKIAAIDSKDRWARAAVLSSIAGRESAFFKELLSHSLTAENSAEILYDTARLLGASQPSTEWPALLRLILEDKRDDDATADRQAVLLAGFGEALRSRGVGRDGSALLEAAGKAEDIVAALKARYAASGKVARDEDASPARRKIAVDLLAHSDFDTAGEVLLSLVDPHQPAVLQAAALRALSRMRDDSISISLFSADRFAAYTPGLRDEVMSAMLSGPHHIPGLLTAIEKGVVPRGAVDSLRRNQLKANKDASIRDRANKLFSLEAAGNRAKVYDELKSVVQLPAHPSNGRAVFKRVCANCHRLDQEGSPVGPDLFGIRNQPKEAILLHIVIPEQEITPGFAAYVLSTKDGRVLTGLVASETATSVTLKQPQGKIETVLRSDIEELVASKLSLMPQNIETQINRQEFADLLAYLKGER